MGITVSHASMLAHCHALTQACSYSEGKLQKWTLNISMFMLGKTKSLYVGGSIFSFL